MEIKVLMMSHINLLSLISSWKLLFVKQGLAELAQPVIISGDLNAEPSVIPVAARR